MVPKTCLLLTGTDFSLENMKTTTKLRLMKIIVDILNAVVSFYRKKQVLFLLSMLDELFYTVTGDRAG